MKKSKKNYAIIALVVILIAIAIGYAAFTATLTIKGTVSGTGTWDVHFKSARLVDANGDPVNETEYGKVTLSKVEANATGNDTITATITLNHPGDGVLLEAVVENSGSIPAKLTDFTIENANDDLEVTKKVDALVPNTETLASDGGTCTATFLVKWKVDSTATELTNKKFTITYNYTQDTTEFTGEPSHIDA